MNTPETVSLEPDPTPAQGAKATAASGYRLVGRRTFGRFELLIEMGHGGMATLYLARIQGPSDFEKLLAIKKIHDHLAAEEQFVRMFLDEARIAAKIHHPNVATIFDLGQIDSSYFIAMEYVHGQNLTDVLKATVRDQARLPWSMAVRIVADAAAGLHAAHELRGTDGAPLGVVHRDVSPQNILISYDGVVKVVDFGVAFATKKLDQTVTGTLKGKVSYMSPEQARGQPLDRRTDVFALGILLWESVCFRRLFREEHEGATLLKVRAAEVPSPREVNPKVPPNLDRVIRKALAREPADRFATADELSEALEEVLTTHGQVAGRKQLSKMLTTLFRDRRQLKDKQIQDALASASPTPMVGVGMRGSDTLSLARTSDSAARESPARAPRSFRWLLWVVTLGAVLVASAAVTLLVLRPFDQHDGGKPSAHGAQGPAPGDAQAPARTDPAMQPTPRPAGSMLARIPARRPSDRVTIRILVTPAQPSVEVSFRGTKHHGANFEMVVPRSERAETIQVSAPDFAPQTLVVVPSGDTEIPVRLVALPRMAPPPRRRTTHRRRRRPMRSGLWDLPK